MPYSIRAQTPSVLLRTNRLLDYNARETARRRTILFPLLQRSRRDLQLQSCLALGKIFALTPRSQATRERLGSKTLMPRVMRSCPESHCRKDDTIRDSRIASSPQFKVLPGQHASLVATAPSNYRTAGAPITTHERSG